MQKSCFLLLCLSISTIIVTGCTPKPIEKIASETSEPPLFREVAESAGLHYSWEIPGKRPLNILQTIGNGCAFFDFDNDGNQDILLVGSPLALYKGDGKGRFTDATRQSGLHKLKGHFLGCAVGDYDNDDFPDVYLTAYQGGMLLHNEAGKHGGAVSFKDVSAAAGVTRQPWGTSAAFVETIPGSGKLDLIVANYARFSNEPTIPQLCEQKALTGLSLMTSCGPRHYTPIKAVLFRNRGGGFAPAVTLAMTTGRGLGVAACDYAGVGRQSIAFANDETTGDLLENKGGGKFANVGTESGTAYDRDGNVHGGMGIDWGDYDNDGRFDLIVATFQNEAKSLYQNTGDGIFTDEAYPTAIGVITRPYVAFGCKFLDYDNDGWLDVAIANGHVQDNIAEIDSSTTYRQSFQLCHNQGPVAGKRVTFEDVSQKAGADALRKIVGRGLAEGDYDNDGRIDLLLVDSEGKPLLLHNEAQKVGHWLGVKLIGKQSNRDGYGAIVTLKVGGQTRIRHCHSDGSYMSASDPRIHFGLGASDTVEELTVRWPSGKVERIGRIPTDRYVTIHEGYGIRQ